LKFNYTKKTGYEKELTYPAKRAPGPVIKL